MNKNILTFRKFFRFVRRSKKMKNPLSLSTQGRQLHTTVKTPNKNFSSLS